MPRASGVFLVTFVRNTDEGCRRFIGESLTVFFTPLLQIQSNPKLDSKTKNSKKQLFFLEFTVAYQGTIDGMITLLCDF